MNPSLQSLKELPVQIFKDKEHSKNIHLSHSYKSETRIKLQRLQKLQRL